MNRNAVSTLEERIGWLMKHPEYLTNEQGRDLQERVVKAMKAAGLFSIHTNVHDVRIGPALHEAQMRWNAKHSPK